MTGTSRTDSEDVAVREWLAATSFSTNSSWQFEPEAFGSVSEEDVPRASVILSKMTKANQAQGMGEESDGLVTEIHLRDLTQLSAHFFDMLVILERVKRDLDHFTARKDSAIQLIAENKELPGIDILAAVGATNTITLNTVETSMSDISDFMEMLSGMRQTMEGDVQPIMAKEPSYWTPSSDAEAWNIAIPGDELTMMDSAEKTCDSPTNEYTLKYHSDVDNLNSPKLYIPRIQVENQAAPQSRRVVLSNLPTDATISQVLKGIRCYGGLISVTLTKELHKASCVLKTAMVEAVYPQAATDIASCFQNQEIVFLDSGGVEHPVEAFLIPTPSYYHSETNHALLDRGCTRALCLPKFPMDAIWYLLQSVGIQHVHTVLARDGRNLFVEFTSLFEAGRIERLIRFGFIKVNYDATKQTMHFVPDSSQGDMMECKDNVINYIDPNNLKNTWDRAPYNSYSPENTHNMTNNAVSEQALKPTHEDTLADYFSIDPSEVWSFLEDRKYFHDTTYKIIGSTISLTRHKWSWSISAEDDMKLLMANTLHDPEWADEWDEHFIVRGMVNLRTWEEYGMLAEHRRERADEEGLDEALVPVCDDCAWGCKELKTVPVPAFIEEYLVFKGAEDEYD